MNDSYDINDELGEDIEEDAPVSEPVKTTDADNDARVEIVGIRFKKNGKTYYFAPNGFTLKQDDRVIVDTSRGQEYGFTAVTNREIRKSEISEPLRCVLRMATPEDTVTHEENVRREIDAFNACIVLIDKHRLGMKLIDAELAFDRSKLIFYFSADGRIDFRELVKDLAGSFHTRIEMRQIGIRDEAKILGGLGICGRPYCCNTFLSDFGQVSVKMAKEQNLSLNSAKISGSCGRLMCCLRYEYDTYLAEKALTPKVDSRVVTPNGAGVVVAANPLAGIVKVRLDGQDEDAEATVFVREDVVDESKYEGQVLTKTEIPDKKRKNDDIPSLAELSATKEAAPEPQTETRNEDGQKGERHGKHQQKGQKPQKQEPDSQPDPQHQNEGKQRNKNRHKKHGKPSQPQGSQPQGSQPQGSQPQGSQPQGSQSQSKKPDQKGAPEGEIKEKQRNAPHPEHQQKKQSPDGAQPKSGEGQQGQPKKNKKWHRPYHGHGGKPKPKDGGSGE